MLMSDTYRRPLSVAAHFARRLIKAYDICSAIRYLFADDVIYFLELFTVFANPLADLLATHGAAFVLEAALPARDCVPAR